VATNFETFEYDVLVIGAGGAGLRAAIEASAAGVKVGLVCKSLLGKAHTVMAEGGLAAALANVDDRDNWRVHFSDTMRGGQYVNNWRMAELHAKEAPDRVKELEAWGAVFDRTPDGKILQRNFGGHRYPRLVMANVSWARSVTTASGAASRFSRPTPSCSPPAASGAPTRLPPIPGKAPVTDNHWLIMRARNWRTWNSSSFIRPA
jgi:succinate dehydrogenase/fumarate reductase flavoprotein subunit